MGVNRAYGPGTSTNGRTSPPLFAKPDSHKNANSGEELDGSVDLAVPCTTPTRTDLRALDVCQLRQSHKT